MIKYQVVNGTSYHTETPFKVIKILELARLNKSRIHICLGDVKTGRDWNEVCDVKGYIGRSGGPVKVPLLVSQRRSVGGSPILDHCVVKIAMTSGDHKVLYQHPTYNQNPEVVEKV